MRLWTKYCKTHIDKKKKNNIKILWCYITEIILKLSIRAEVPNPWAAGHYQATACSELGCAVGSPHASSSHLAWRSPCISGSHLVLAHEASLAELAAACTHMWTSLFISGDAFMHTHHSQGIIPSPTPHLSAKPERLGTTALEILGTFSLQKQNLQGDLMASSSNIWRALT